ncbi:hypothetical protein [Psychroserpens sp. MEBiC05023]
MNKLLLFTALLLSSFSFSQGKLEFIDRDEIISLASNNGQNGNNAKALEYLNKINKNDSSYCSILTSKSYYLLELKKYNEVIEVINEGLDRDCISEQHSYYINLSVAYMRMKEYTKAVDVIDSALIQYPNNYILWYNKGISLENLGKLDEAILAYQKTIILNPYYVYPHLKLGNVCFKQEQMAQAMMCYNMYLLLQTDKASAPDIIKSLNNIVSATNSNEANPEIKISPDDTVFQKLDNILNKKVALKKGYKTKNEIDLNLVKQNHLLLNELVELKANDGFWDQKYLPFYNWIMENDFFDDFIYTLLYSTENEDIKKIIEIKSNNISAFYNAFREKWKTIIAQNRENIGGENKVVTYYFNDSYVSAIGEIKDEQPVGKWTYYNENGQLKSQGVLDLEGQKIGEWTWYHPNGKKKETAIYEHGKLNGNNKQWFENGKLYYEANFSLDSLDNEYKSYRKSGALFQKKYYNNGSLDGVYESYFPVGQEIVEFNIPYKNGLIEGKVLEYYSNGNVYSETLFSEGVKNGIEKKYGINKKLSSEGTLLNGSYHGEYRTYHSNGNIYEEGHYDKGLLEGIVKRFYRDGTLESKFKYSKGKLDGLYVSYDYDGLLFNEFNYKNGEMVSYKFFDKKGNIIEENSREDDNFYYKGFSPNGILVSEGLFDNSGGKKGTWKFYSNNGIKIEEGNYIDDKADGAHVTFYKNGQTESTNTYREDLLNGYYENYYKNSQLKSHGYYKNDLAIGEWRYYYIDGTLQQLSYFHDGKLHGDQVSYDGKGKLSNIYSYNYGEILSETRFDINGKQFEVIMFESEKKPYKIMYRHFNKKLDIDVDYVNAVMHGKYLEYYFEGNLAVKGTYLNGLEHGEWIWFFENGEIKSKRNYNLGELDGEAIDYYENKQMENQFYYDLGKPSGKWTSYHDNGHLDTVTEYNFGENHGRKEFYSPEGKLQLIRFYDHDELIGYSYLDKNAQELSMIPLENETGIITAYFDNGNVSREMEYLNGDLINTYKSYFYSGKVENEIDYKLGEYQGVVINYFPNGKVKKLTNYLFGNRHGVSKTFREDGTIEKEKKYHNDKIINSKQYNKKGTLVKTKHYFDENVYRIEDN